MWYAAETPVIPEPMMQMSASCVSAPVLPSFPSGFAPGVSTHSDLVGFGTGRPAGPLCTGNSIAACSSAMAFRTRGSVDMTVSRKRDKLEKDRIDRLTRPVDHSRSLRSRLFQMNEEEGGLTQRLAIITVVKSKYLSETMIR